MTSHELIDAQFDRAVEIVQSLPTTGPIQTDYEEKLLMYSLFKQATVGNVASPRPGIWDMLGRAKWDAWAKHKDLDSYEAKWLYVEALLKVLRRYSDKTVAMALVQELESYGDPSHLVMSRSFTRSPGSEGSGSTASDDDDDNVPLNRLQPPAQIQEPITDTSEEEDSETEQLGALPIRTSAEIRPGSSISSHRYRTPLAGSLHHTTPPPPPPRLPSQQPMPGFETPSAFGDTHTSASPSAVYPLDNPYTRTENTTPQPQPSVYRYHPAGNVPARPTSTLTLERAVENVQVHLAAISERLQTLEMRSLGSSQGGSHHSLPWTSGQFPHHGQVNERNGGNNLQWDLDDLGMWSYVLNPIAKALHHLKHLAVFFAHDETRSPSAIVVRRLCLDVSFLVFVVVLLGSLWRKSGVRRREVKAALVILWKAIVGSKPSPSSRRRRVNRAV